MLQSFPVPRPTTNPYLVMLAESLRRLDDVRIVNFSWRTALLGRYDVFHAHWPEILVAGHSKLKKAVRQVFFVLLLLKLSISRTPIVRTMHNLALPQGISRIEIALLQAFDRQTTLRILLNPATELPDGQASRTILHGHYRDWFASFPTAESIAGRITYFGLIRRYKNVEGLIKAFSQLADHIDASLTVSGRPSSPDLEQTLHQLSADDSRISLTLRFISDAELVTDVTSSELVVLPYREMHNSGGALTSLSLDRAVLVPDNDANRQFQAEVGERWVHLYAGDLTAADIATALHHIQQRNQAGLPNLSGRNWDKAGLDHFAAYKFAVELRRSARRR